MSRCIWQKLANAGANVPLDPADLDATHLIIAAASGVDVAAMMKDVTTPPGSAGHLRSA
jgi:hypothetical protein